jgi:dTMP kinase
MSLFITFEGGEGSGKSVQAKALYKRLKLLAIPTVLTFEPGGTPFGNKLAHWLKWVQEMDISPLTELMLFNASRAQLVKKIIFPGLANGKLVICDRYADSTTAYQSYGRGLELPIVKAVNNIATQGLEPSLTILLDISVVDGLSRKNTKKRDRFEQESIVFHQKVRDGYLKLADEEPKRWFLIDANQSQKRISDVIWKRVKQLLSERGNVNDG